MQVAGDILVKNLDWPEAQLIAKRLKVMLPPQVQAVDEDPIPPQIKQAMAEMKDVIDKGQLHIQDLEAQLKDKTMEYAQKKRELDIKNKDTNIKAFNAKVDVLKEIPASSNEIDGLLKEVDDIVSTSGSTDIVTEKREQDKTLQAQQQHDEMMRGIVGIVGIVKSLVNEVSKPTVAVRDENGVLIGTKKAQ